MNLPVEICDVVSGWAPAMLVPASGWSQSDAAPKLMWSAERLVRRALAGTALAATALLIGGCLYVPTPNGRTIEGSEVKDDDLSFLKPGVTTKAEVTAQFGNPTMFWRDENIFVYRWVRREGVLVWAVAAGYSGSFGAADIPQELAFLLKFDRDDRLVGSEIVKRPMLKSYGEFLLEWRDAQRAKEAKEKKVEP